MSFCNHGLLTIRIGIMMKKCYIIRVPYFWNIPIQIETITLLMWKNLLVFFDWLKAGFWLLSLLTLWNQLPFLYNSPLCWDLPHDFSASTLLDTAFFRSAVEKPFIAIGLKISEIGYIRSQWQQRNKPSFSEMFYVIILTIKKTSTFCRVKTTVEGNTI